MMNKINGILLSMLVGAIAVYFAKYIPIGSVALAIVIGIFIGNVFFIGETFSSGITFSEKTLLAWAIALMGINLDFAILTQLGVKSIILIIAAMIVTILSALLLAKLFKFDYKFALILGIGNGVCGSSAIAATKDIVGLDKQKVGLSIAIVNFLGTVGIFVVPLIGVYILNLTDINNGILIGNTLQAVGQVLAGGFSISETTGQTAIIVKMGRILMLTPLIFVLIFFLHRHKKEENALHKAEIPVFIYGFIAFSVAATIHLFPDNLSEIIKHTSHYCLLVAMAAIGLKINFKTILQHGSKSLLIGTLIFVIQIIFSGLTVAVLFQ